jgi:hypothetical protein
VGCVCACALVCRATVCLPTRCIPPISASVQRVQRHWLCVHSTARWGQCRTQLQGAAVVEQLWTCACAAHEPSRVPNSTRFLCSSPASVFDDNRADQHASLLSLPHAPARSNSSRHTRAGAHARSRCAAPDSQVAAAAPADHTQIGVVAAATPTPTCLSGARAAHLPRQQQQQQQQTVSRKVAQRGDRAAAGHRTQDTWCCHQVRGLWGVGLALLAQMVAL